jgi:nucleotide-binding universal stress UspA family protein
MSRILVPLDGTVRAEEALPTAVSLARRLHRELELILVNESRPGGGLEGWPWAISSARSHGEYVVDQAARLTTILGRPVTHSVAEGRSADEICRRAAASRAGLIVMTSRAYTGLGRMLGGSVADVVMRHSRIPVLLLRPATSGRRVRPAVLHTDRILVAFDGSREARAALDAAVSLSDHGVTELHLVRVVSPVPVDRDGIRIRGARMDRSATRAAVDRADEELTAVADDVAARTGCDTYVHIIVGSDAARGILRTARGFNASVIAMGTHGRGASRLLIGSVAERVLGDGRYPMLIVHPPPVLTSPTAIAEESCVLPQLQ